MSADVARNVYQQIEVNSASGLELVVMLYDGAIRFLGDAKAAIQNRDLVGKATAINRALAIVGELQSTLKMEEGGEVAQSLDRLYVYVTERILEASLKLNVKPLDEAIKLLSILNSGWTEIAKNAQRPQEAPAALAAAASAGMTNREFGGLEVFG